MAQAGDVLDSPISGERVLFRRTEADTDGRFLEVDIFLRAGGMGPPEHIHLLQSERFRVMAGRLAAKIDGQVHRLSLGRKPSSQQARRTRGGMRATTSCTFG